MIRIYQKITFEIGATVALDKSASHHVGNVLRAKINDLITLFNGQGGEYLSHIIAITKKEVSVKIDQFIDKNTESPLSLYLAQGISRGEKMDFTIQKAVELGVKKIFPVLTERSTIKLDADRIQKRLTHWESIIVSACEQSGRNFIPKISLPESINTLHEIEAEWRFILSPNASTHLKTLPIQKNDRVLLLIGPEGGFSEKEILTLVQKDFIPLNLGPRILRTETAGLAAIAALQCLFGDL
jgi:16S rRNA (uracil1498-N3)-methyltransferase